MKINKTLGLFLLLTFLAAVTWYAYQDAEQKDKISEIKEDRLFTVTTKEEIGKIVLTRAGRDVVTFERSGGQWLLDKKYRADDVVVDQMLQVLTKMQMKSIPSKNATVTIKEAMMRSGIRVDVYDAGEDMVKSFTIGSDIQSGEGTYMLVTGKDQPYVMELPGLGGGLRSRFEQPLYNYRDKFIYREQADNISSIEVIYPKDQSASFVLSSDVQGYRIAPHDPLSPARPEAPNPGKVKTYIRYFDELGAERLYNEFTGKDTVRALTPFAEIRLTRKDGTQLNYRYWSYDAYVLNARDIRRVQEALTPERYFVETNGGDFYTVQTRVFGKIFAGYSYFF